MSASSTDFWEMALPADMMLLAAAVNGQLSANERKAIESPTARPPSAPALRARWRRRRVRSSSCETWLGQSNREPIKRLADSLEELRKALKGENAN